MSRYKNVEEHHGRFIQRFDCMAARNGIGYEIYRATRAFPRDEIYSLTNQLRRGAVSVPSNIAEGQARFSRKEFHHFLSQARGSLVEVETQLMIAQNLEYLSPQETCSLLGKTAQLGKVLNGLIASIKSAA